MTNTHVDGGASIDESAIECATHTGGNGNTVAWRLAHATPEERCRAAVHAVLQQGGEA